MRSRSPGDRPHDGSRPPGDRAAARGPSAAPGPPEVLGAEGLLDLQRTAGNAAVARLVGDEPSPVHDVLASGSGAALDAPVRADMERAFGTDFSEVRVHTDDRAHRSAESVGAQAYTVGSEVVFRQGGYDPGSAAGRHVLAHELAHVVQQRQGPVDGTDIGGGVAVSDPDDRFEREAAATADSLMAQRALDPVDVDHPVDEEDMP